MAKNIKAQYTYRAGTTTPDEIVERIASGIKEAGSFPAFVNALIVQNETLRNGEEMPLTPITQSVSSGSSYDDTRLMAELSSIREDIQGLNDNNEVSPILLEALKKIMSAVGAIHNESVTHYENICTRLDEIAENSTTVIESQDMPTTDEPGDNEETVKHDDKLDDDSILGLDAIINDTPPTTVDNIERITDDVDSPFYNPITLPKFDLDQSIAENTSVLSAPASVNVPSDDKKDNNNNDDDILIDDDDVIDGLQSLLS